LQGAARLGAPGPPVDLPLRRIGVDVTATMTATQADEYGFG
jgi:hypothetical protein